MKRSISPRVECFEDRLVLSHLPTMPFGHPGAHLASRDGFAGIQGVLAANQTIVHPGESVDLTLTLTNQTKHVVNLSFSDSAAAIVVMHRGRVLLSSGIGPASTMEHVALDPGSSVTYRNTFHVSFKGAAGKYTVKSDLDPHARWTSFRVEGGPIVEPPVPSRPGGGVPGGTGSIPGNGNQPIVSKSGKKDPVNPPPPSLPPIINPGAHPTGSNPTGGAGTGTTPINPGGPIRQPTPTPGHKPTSTDRANGVRPIVRPTSPPIKVLRPFHLLSGSNKA